jgi:hypothetical protein
MIQHVTLVPGWRRLRQALMHISVTRAHTHTHMCTVGIYDCRPAAIFVGTSNPCYQLHSAGNNDHSMKRLTIKPMVIGGLSSIWDGFYIWTWHLWIDKKFGNIQSGVYLRMVCRSNKCHAAFIDTAL